MSSTSTAIGALVDTDQLPWKPLDRGQWVKLLRVNEETGGWAMLVRAEAGSVNGRHMHMGPADFYVIEGCIDYVGGVANAGAYVFEPAGAVHDRTTHPVDTLYFANVYGSLAFLDENDRVTGVMDGFMLRAQLERA